MRSHAHVRQLMPWLVGGCGVTLLVPLLYGLVWAQDLTFSATVDEIVVDVGSPITLTITLSGEIAGIRLPAFEFPEGLIVSGRSQSTNFALRAGTMERSMSLTYVLVPQRAGTFTLGPFYLEHADQTIPTEPIEITVEKPAIPPFLEPQGERLTL